MVKTYAYAETSVLFRRNVLRKGIMVGYEYDNKVVIVIWAI